MKEKKEKITRRAFLGKTAKIGTGIAAASLASKFIGKKSDRYSALASGKKATKLEPKEGLASGMIGGPTGFDGAEKYQYGADEAPGRAMEALRKMQADGKAPKKLVLMEPPGEDAVSFEVISAVLSDTAEGGFTRRLLHSGHAPLTPGSKAAVAAVLSPQGATLLWNTLQEPTSDISVSIHGCYEASVAGYNAKVTAEVSTVYKHFSAVINMQKGYKRRQLQKIVDETGRAPSR